MSSLHGTRGALVSLWRQHGAKCLPSSMMFLVRSPRPRTSSTAFPAAVSSSASSTMHIQMLARRQIVAVMEGKTRPSSSSFSMPYIVPNNKPELDPERTYVLQVKGVTTRQCRGAGIGLVLYDPVFKLELWCGGIYAEGYRIGFEAEYSALIMGMDYVHNVLGVRRMILQSSYHAVVNQVTGEFTSNKRSLRILLHSVKTLEQNFQDFAIQHVSLSELSKAESLAHTALATRKSTRSVELNSFPLDEKDPIRESLARKSNQLQPDIRAKSVSIDPSRTYLLQFDGGARSEYGVAGAGMVIYDVERDLEVWCGWYFHDNFATNNVAEYLGLVYGLKCAKSLGIRKLAVEGDSLLIVRQMNLNYLTREESLLVLRDEARLVAEGFDQIIFEFIRRSENRRADWLASYAMNNKSSHGFVFLHSS